MWDFFEPIEGQWYAWRLDGAAAYLRKSGDEWRVFFTPARFQDIRADSGGPEPAEPSPEKAAGAPYIVASGGSVALVPHFDERPYLITARNELRILSGAQARFEVALPALFRVRLDTGAILGDVMPYTLSNTWFGDKTGGALCRSIPLALDPICRGEASAPGAAAAAACADSGCPSLVRCSIVVRNDSKTPIDLKRLAIYTDLLNIYRTEAGLATDPVTINGLADGGLRMSVSEATLSDGRTVLAPARMGQKEMLIRRGVNFLRAVTGM